MTSDREPDRTRAAIDAVWRIESARVIGGLARIVHDIAWAEDLGWAYDVRWPDGERLSARLTGVRGQTLGSMTDRQAPKTGDRKAA